MVRAYIYADYEQLKVLYLHTDWYGVVFDKARDGRKRLADITQKDPRVVLVYEEDSVLKGTISIIEDGRVAMLCRFVTAPKNVEIAEQLYAEAIAILRNRGHNQILVYSAVDNEELDKRYLSLGMAKGGNYACFWADI